MLVLLDLSTYQPTDVGFQTFFRTNSPRVDRSPLNLALNTMTPSRIENRIGKGYFVSFRQTEKKASSSSTEKQQKEFNSENPKPSRKCTRTTRDFVAAKKKVRPLPPKQK